MQCEATIPVPWIYDRIGYGKRWVSRWFHDGTCSDGTIFPVPVGWFGNSVMSSLSFSLSLSRRTLCFVALGECFQVAQRPNDSRTELQEGLGWYSTDPRDPVPFSAGNVDPKSHEEYKQGTRTESDYCVATNQRLFKRNIPRNTLPMVFTRWKLNRAQTIPWPCKEFLGLKPCAEITTSCAKMDWPRFALKKVNMLPHKKHVNAWLPGLWWQIGISQKPLE